MGDIDKEIELGARSIRVSYRSYLSDAAPGFALILILFFSYFYPILGITLKELYPFSNLPSEILIFISVLLIFFSVPLGLTLNASSWILMGGLQNKMEGKWLDSNSYLIKGTKDALLFHECEEFYKLRHKCSQESDGKYLSKRWFLFAKLNEELLSFYYPEKVDCLGRYEGIVQFTRSMGFLLILILISNIFSFFVIDGYENHHLILGYWYIIFIFIFIIIFSFIINPIIAFYYDLYNLTIGYLCCQTKEECPQDIDDVKELIKLLLLKRETFWIY